MLKGKPGDKKISFEENPTIVADNYFEIFKSIEVLGEKGFGQIVTVGRIHFPKDIAP